MKGKICPREGIELQGKRPRVPGALKAWARGEPKGPWARGASAALDPWAAHDASGLVYH